MGLLNTGLLSILFLSLVCTGCNGGKSNSSTSTPPATTIPPPNYAKLTPSYFSASASNPVMTRGAPATAFAADWNDPSVIKMGNQYVMYATSDNNFDFNIGVYRLVSSDGLNWTPSPATPVLQADPNVSAWDHQSANQNARFSPHNVEFSFSCSAARESRLVNIGVFGHVNSSSGLDMRPEGYALYQGLAA